MVKYLVEVEGNDLLFAKNNGIDDKKEKLDDEKICEDCVYRHRNGNLAIPAINFKGTFRNAYIKKFTKWKEASEEFERYVTVYPIDENDRIHVDLGVKTYSRIYKRSVLINKDKYGAHKAVGFAVNPILDKWKASFFIDIRLKGNTDTKNKEIIEVGGEEIGVCGWRKGNFGTFRLTKFEKVKSS